MPPINDNDDPTKLDDLWHAAVNGRGRFVSANDAPSLYDGLVTALTDLRVLVGAAAASATSSPNITTTDNAIYSSTYRTTRWDGELVAQRIDPSPARWSDAVAVVGARSAERPYRSAATDTRTIYTSVERCADAVSSGAILTLRRGPTSAASARSCRSAHR